MQGRGGKGEEGGGRQTAHGSFGKEKQQIDSFITLFFIAIPGNVEGGGGKEEGSIYFGHNQKTEAMQFQEEGIFRSIKPHGIYLLNVPWPQIYGKKEGEKGGRGIDPERIFLERGLRSLSDSLIQNIYSHRY